MATCLNVQMYHNVSPFLLSYLDCYHFITVTIAAKQSFKLTSEHLGYVGIL